MENIRFEIEGKVAHVILDRPEKHNCFNDKTILELTECFDRIEKDHAVRAVLISSTGPSFSAGGDLAWMKKTRTYTEDQNFQDAKALAEMLRRLNMLPKPTVAKVQGPAFGGGVGLIACCDIVVAADHATLCLSEVKLGLSPATISPYVIHAMGASQARRYFLTAETFSASKAQDMGLVHEVCASGNLDAVANGFLKALLKNGPEALAIAKSLIFLTEPMITAKIQEETSRCIARQRVGREGQEGLSAFFEKRTAAWVNDV